MKTALELAEELRTDLDADVERLTNELRIAKTEAEKAKENMAELIAGTKTTVDGTVGGERRRARRKP